MAQNMENLALIHRGYNPPSSGVVRLDAGFTSDGIGLNIVNGSIVVGGVTIVSAAGVVSGTISLTNPTALGTNAVGTDQAAANFVFNSPVSTGAAAPAQILFGLTLAGSSGSTPQTLATTFAMTPNAFQMQSPAGQTGDLQYVDAASNQARWILRKAGNTESGSNSGSDFLINARADNGSSIDVPLNIVRAAGGLFSISRPLALNGQILIGSSSTPNAARMAQVGGGAALTGADQFALLVNTTFGSAATSSGTGIDVILTTAAASFTMSNGYGVKVDIPSIGAASAITAYYGLIVKNPASASITNAVGLQIEQPTSAVTQNQSIAIIGTAATQTNGMSLTGSTTGAVNAVSSTNTTGGLTIGVESSAGAILLAGTAAYGTVLSTGAANTALYLGTNNVIRLTIAAGGAATFSGALAITGALTGVTSLTMSAALSGATSLGFSTNLISTTALATPGALAATQFTGFASTVSGASLMGYGTTNDVTLMNRAGTVVLGVTANTTGVTMAGALAITGALSGVTTLVTSGTVTVGTNLGINNAASLGGGAGVIAVTNATTAPGSNPAGGGVLYATAGALFYRGSNGTVTIIAPA